MSRIDTASRSIAATPGEVFAAFVDPVQLVAWLPPAGMRGRFDHFDARPGGSYRMVLLYGDPDVWGKAGDGSDVVQARFTEIVSGVRVVQEVDFESEDPAFTGTMTMTWEVHEADGGALVECRAENVPTGISPEAHVAGMSSSLANLATYLEA